MWAECPHLKFLRGITMVKFLMSLCKPSFGEFEKREFLKFLRLGVILMTILGTYWMMKPLKDSIFTQLVGADAIPYAKTVSVFFIIVLVAAYTKILDFVEKSKLLAVLPAMFYGTIMAAFAFFVQAFQSGIIAKSLLTTVVGYIWYCLVESFGSIIVALFWAFSTDITKSESAKKGFPLIVAFGQIGGILFPYLFINLPINIGFGSDFLALLIAACLTLLIYPLVKHFMKKTPADLVASQTLEKNSASKKEKTGFMEGLRILFSSKYLLGIFAINFFFEVITTIFDYNYKNAAARMYVGSRLTQYYSLFASVVNLVSFVFLVLGINKITKYMGLKISLACVPIFFGLSIFGFLTVNSLSFLFCLMVACKAVNYSLNGPSLKQLYIPTSSDAKSKSQAWIETFGSRISKESGSVVNMFKPLGESMYRILSCGLGSVFVVAWLFVALYLGKTHKKAIDTNTNVC